MGSIDLSPLYRNSVGFDRFGTLLDTALRGESNSNGYPPYDIEALDEDRYVITLAVAGFERSDLDLQVENGVLTIRGKRKAEKKPSTYLHQGIASRSFERKFNLADHVEVKSAGLEHGLLSVNLKKEIPEAMKPRTIAIGA